MILKCLLLAVVLCGSVIASQLEEGVNEVIKVLPKGLQAKANESEIKDVGSKSKEVFKDKCTRNGGPDAFTNVGNGFKEYITCVQKLVDIPLLEQEIQDAKPTGRVDEVFKKYCAKTPQFEACFLNLTQSAAPCFSREEKMDLRIVFNVTIELAKFVCHKDGDRLALFIAEGGPECLQMSTDHIQDCINKTLGTDLQVGPGGNVTGDYIPKLGFTIKECTQLSDLQLCMVEGLRQCNNTTPANIIESIFKFVRKSTPCIQFGEPTPRQSQSLSSSASSGLTVTLITIYLTIVSLFF